MLETFDAPVMTPNCECRNSSTVTPQSLLLMNNVFVIEQSEIFAERLQREAGADLAAQVRLGWQSAFGRSPTERQAAEAAAFIAQQAEVFSVPATVAKTAESDRAAAKPAVDEAALRALSSFCQSLLCSNGFLYVD
jgi:hypothetical protein